LVLLPGSRAALVVTSHHLVVDGWSGPLIVGDLFAMYLGGHPLTSTDSGDFATFLRWLARRDDAAARAVWSDALARLDGPTVVAPGRVATEDARPREHVIDTGADLGIALGHAARRLGVTTSTLLQFGWAVLLSRLTGQTTVGFGETVSGRPAD
ncbi:hypothetical protein G3I15_30945, partial [Streptomyces sp. SID10244]|nr:hypothetical protein [Streptomyces sp. SID10244]